MLSLVSTSLIVTKLLVTNDSKAVIGPNFPTIGLVEKSIGAHIGPYGSNSIRASGSRKIQQC